MPFDKLKLIIDYLRGTAVVSRNQLIHAITALIDWADDLLFPAAGAAVKAVPAWLELLIPLLLQLLSRFLAPKPAATTESLDQDTAAQLEGVLAQAQAA